MFAKEPRDREAWSKYRREILEPGASCPDKLSMLENFIGHSSTSDALIEDLKEFHGA